MQYADYSGGRPSGAALKAAGFSGVVRYIGLGGEGKQLIASEYKDLVATFGAQHVLLVAEAGTGDAWGTETDDDYARGVAYGNLSVADARAQGVPDWVPLACAADAHAQAFQIDDVVRYARGFEAAVGKARCGFYGFSETLTAVHNAGVGSWYWRCGSEPTAAEKQWVNLWQRNTAPTVRTVAGVPCDINDVYHPILQGDDMPITDDDANKIAGKVWYNWIWSQNNGATGQNPSQILSILNGQLGGLTAALTAQTKLIVENEANDITADKLAESLRGAITAELAPIVHDAVTAALGEDNGHQAAETADAILQRIATKFTSAS